MKESLLSETSYLNLTFNKTKGYCEVYLLLTSMKPLLAFCVLFVCVTVNAQLDFKRLSPSLQNIISKKNENETVDVFLTLKNPKEFYRGKKVIVLKEYAPSGTVLVRIKVSELKLFLSSDQIIFADAYRQPKEELTTGTLDISLNKINFSHNQFPSINGDSVFASVKEQRFDTTDIDIEGRYFNSGVASPFQSSHASIMATMLAGAGNTSPYAIGAAPGSYVTSSDFASLLPDADSVYSKYKITVQNHSYGTGIENYYGADAAAFDMSTKNNPSLIHVFSSGNSGNSTSGSGNYTGIPGFANITGSFKMAKNIISVGATDSFNHVVALSSKGPAYDGRVKPELVAFGEDGSSGAAALVSGSATLVQQAYKLFHNNQFPSNTLVKAILLNSADDVEKPHIDYSSGYGALNTYKAVKTVVENHFFENGVAQNETKDFTISIPANVSQAKFTIVWMDVPAVANAAKALVNDIDAQVQFPFTNETWLPWVLNSSANADSIKAPAQRKIDTLNTVEQVTIDNPQAGDYVLQVKGSRIQQGMNQSFAVAYQFDSLNHFVWTYPASTDALLGSKNNVVRWETTINDTATIEYSLDGLQWKTLATGINLNDHYFQWTTPDTLSIAFLRMKISSVPSSFVSDSFTISRTLDLKVGFNCVDSFLLYWNQLPVNQYQLYQLGQKYLQPFLLTPDTIAVLSKKQFASVNYAVAPIINSKAGFRSFTTDYTTQGVGCYLSSFIGFPQGNNALLRIQLGSVYNIASISIVRMNSKGAQIVQTVFPPLQTVFTVTDANLTRGVNNYQLQIKLANGTVIYSNVESVYYFPDIPVIVYPNPAKQNQPVSIIVQTPGIFFINVYDASGRMILSESLDAIYQQLPPLRLSKGLYLVKIISQGAKPFVEKLIVY